MSPISFAEQVAIVTGSGAGLGRAYAHALAERGAAVLVNDVAGERADAVVAEIEAAGGRAAASYDSVADRGGARSLVATALEAFGSVDILVNNAGTMRNARFEDQTPEDLDAMLAVHVGGCFHVTQAAWPHMREKGYGRVVLVGSAGGMWSMLGIANYAAAKAGVYGLGRALAHEGRDVGIGVNVLLPGAATEIAAGGGPIPGYDELFRPDLRELIAPRRTPESVAPMLLFLASRECAFSGEAFSAVAGRYARVIVGVTDGWYAPELDATPEDIVEHLDEIVDTETFFLPGTLFDEYEAMSHWVGASRGA